MAASRSSTASSSRLSCVDVSRSISPVEHHRRRCRPRGSCGSSSSGGSAASALHAIAPAVRDSAACRARSSRWTCSPTTPYAGNPVAVVLDADGLDTDGDAALRALDEPVRDDVRAPADQRGRGLPRADLHAGRRAAVRGAPDARHLPRVARGRRRARATATWSSRSARPGSCACAGRRRAGVRGAAAAARRARSTRPTSQQIAARAEDRPRRRSSTPRGPTTAPAGSRCCCESADAVLALRPGYVDLDLGVVGAVPAGLAARPSRCGRSSPRTARRVEDPVTGSLNASLAQWLLATGRATAPYVASQGTALGRAGRVHVTRTPTGRSGSAAARSRA